jgi:hypothetical protein
MNCMSPFDSRSGIRPRTCDSIWKLPSRSSAAFCNCDPGSGRAGSASGRTIRPCRARRAKTILGPRQSRAPATVAVRARLELAGHDGAAVEIARKSSTVVREVAVRQDQQSTGGFQSDVFVALFFVIARLTSRRAVSRDIVVPEVQRLTGRVVVAVGPPIAGHALALGLVLVHFLARGGKIAAAAGARAGVRVRVREVAVGIGAVGAGAEAGAGAQVSAYEGKEARTIGSEVLLDFDGTTLGAAAEVLKDAKLVTFVAAEVLKNTRFVVTFVVAVAVAVGTLSEVVKMLSRNAADQTRLAALLLAREVQVCRRSAVRAATPIRRLPGGRCELCTS